MRILLVEPQYRRSNASPNSIASSESETKAVKMTNTTKSEDTLWYPPLGLMKLARFHKDRGDEVVFVSGCDKTLGTCPDLFNPDTFWDRIYITTLFTFHWKSIVETIEFYKKVAGGVTSKIYVGGIMASIMPEDIFEETNIYPCPGVITSPTQIGLDGTVNIDLLPPDYDLVDPSLYAINETYYGYTSRGCVNKCPWCGVPRIEPAYLPYIDIKPSILSMRQKYGDKPRLKLMDNNVLASSHLKQIVDDLVDLGYGRDSCTNTPRKRIRQVDFNQGLDATYLTEERMAMLARLNIKPMRIAFDRVSEKKDYVRALDTARRFGVKSFSNYMLYNFKDSPKDLYERLCVNIELNEKWGRNGGKDVEAEIYSYPMRFAPIDNRDGTHDNRERDLFIPEKKCERNWINDPVWVPRFVRNIEIMKGVAHGMISPTPTLAWRTIGETFEEFITNLYMPEEFLRNRNKHERRVHKFEPTRPEGTGLIEKFREFLLNTLTKDTTRFLEFHTAVAGNSVQEVRNALKQSHDEELKVWLRYYLKK